MSSTSLFVILFSLLAGTGCKLKSQQVTRLRDTPQQGGNTLTREEWISKLARKLRNGRGITSTTELNALKAMSDDQIIAQLMTDPSFGSTVLGFNLYYLGRNLNNLEQMAPDGRINYDPQVFEIPNALSSAKSVFSGGDFYQLYEIYPKFLVPTLSRAQPVAESGSGSGSSSGTISTTENNIGFNLQGDDASAQATLRNQILDKVIADGTTAGTNVRGETTTQFSEATCRAIEAFSRSGELALPALGFTNMVTDRYRTVFLDATSGTVTPGEGGKCSVASDADKTKITNLLADELRFFQSIKTNVATLAGNGAGSGLNALHFLSSGVEAFDKSLTMLTAINFWTPLRNSSTNFNRKRSAYVLRTFLCDDLNSENITIEEMAASKDQHGTNPSCLTCHYKLDPIGGLFRFYGQAGNNYRGMPNLVFDDSKEITGDDLTKYYGVWNDAESRPKVGYYVGLNRVHPQWRGDDLPDLFTFLKTAPEAKSCLVKRMAQYFVGTSHAYDRQWLEQVTGELAPGENSGQAFKSVVTKLVKSNTFRTRDPEPGKCYDYPEGANADSRPDCEINFVLENSCVSCHDSAGPTRGIDFTQFVQIKKSATSNDMVRGFPHFKNGAQLSRQESFQIIRERLTTTERNKRMPRGGVLNEEDRNLLLRWLTTNGN